MSKTDPYNLLENDFIKGLAEGEYTVNDAIKYCQRCYDKVGFLDNIFLNLVIGGLNDRESARIWRAVESVRGYLISEGYELEHNYLCIDKTAEQQGDADNAGLPSDNPAATKQGLPKCFDTPQGRQIFQNAVDGGLLTNYDYQPTQRATNGHLAIFATELGKKLNITDFNAQCERLWGIKHLAQAFQKVSSQKNFDVLETEIKQYFITEE